MFDERTSIIVSIIVRQFLAPQIIIPTSVKTDPKRSEIYSHSYDELVNYRNTRPEHFCFTFLARAREILDLSCFLFGPLFIYFFFFFGLTSNSTNVLGFLKSDTKDTVTILLLCLSLSDFCFLLLLTPSLATILIMNFAPKWNWTFDINIASYLFYWPAFTLYDFSA